MANQRINLVCDVCGEELVIASRLSFPFRSPEGVEHNLDTFFIDHMHGKSSYDCFSIEYEMPRGWDGL